MVVVACGFLAVLNPFPPALFGHTPNIWRHQDFSISLSHRNPYPLFPPTLDNGIFDGGYVYIRTDLCHVPSGLLHTFIEGD
jgi:hypothetical protein